MMVFDQAAGLRKLVYALLTLVVLGIASARVMSIERVYEPSLHRPEGALTSSASAWPRSRPAPTPLLSSNDRSRWATIRALVDEGTFAIGKREIQDGRYRDNGIIFEDGWQSVDKVLDPDTRQFFSSKPPLLSVLVAAEYSVLQKITGWTLKDHTAKVVRTILLATNVIPFAFYLVLLARLIEQLGATDWGRLFTFTAACFGTYISTFMPTLNNHTLAAMTTLAAIYPILGTNHTTLRSLFASGFFAGLTASFELPAMSFLVVLGGSQLLQAPRRTLLAFVPAALLPIGTQAGLNYVAISDWRPVYEKTDSNWYRYDGSHWNKTGSERRGIDFAGDSESRPVYAFHLLLGHHGVFSLTPIWLLSFVGMWQLLRRGLQLYNRLTQVAWVTLIVSIIVITFFAAIVSTVNYGGWTSGPRWFFWLTPLWILSILPIADWLAVIRVGRGLGYALLGVSVFSASYSAWNPWRHPWIYLWMESQGWIRY